jgi:5'(3')-deoxyribonucleotidase
MERIIIDMDEVIADPMNEMIDWYRNQHGRDVDYNKMLAGSWIKGFPEEHQPIIWDRLRAPGFFRHLPVMKDSVSVLRELNAKYELFIVSAATEFPNSLKDKIEWLEDHFPFLSWRQIALCGSKDLVFGDYMIDDHLKNLKGFKGKPYLFTAAHNLEVTGYDRINDWSEAAVIFLK